MIISKTYTEFINEGIFNKIKNKIKKVVNISDDKLKKLITKLKPAGFTGLTISMIADIAEKLDIKLNGYEMTHVLHVIEDSIHLFANNNIDSKNFINN